jgi:isoleucyl-tRNA synthetase
MVRKNPDDPTGQSMMRRVPDVFDCWFESGSMPYAQLHYPFENKEKFEKYPSADFIVEYAAQTRGWFYTLMVLSTALFNKPPFLNCICHGVILDETGQKLSKRLQNYVDPKELFAKFGSDALRFLMMSSSVMRGQELLIDKEGQMVHDVIRLTIKPIWNAYNFFTLYANTDQLQAKLIHSSNNFNDQYILSKLGIAIQKIEQAMDIYEISDACAVLHGFVETLNNWYIRRNRNRFWASEKNADKQQAYDTLYTVLCMLCRCAAPLLPLTLENIYLGLTNAGKLTGDASVHLTSYPYYSLFPREIQLVNDIDKVQEICTAALNIRNLENIRIRQPLAELMIIGKNFSNLKQYFKLIEEELNVKKVTLLEDVEKYAEQKLKILFPVVGKRLPHKIKSLIEAVKNKEWKLDTNNQLLICDEILVAGEFDLVLETFNKQAVALSSQDAVVILDTELNEELQLEGIARDVVRAVQQARKDADLQISDRIKLGISCSDHLLKAIKLHKDYICSQTLCHEIEYELAEKHNHQANVKIDNADLDFTIVKI